MKITANLLFALLAVLPVTGCNGDDGPECQTDADCTPPETCQPDNTCAYTPDPEANQAVMTFTDMEMDYPNVHGRITVDGKFDGKYLFMDYGGLIEFNQTENRTEMQLFGLITNTLLNVLVIRLPRDCPLSQHINFGTGGVAVGTLEQLELDDQGQEIDQTKLGDIVDGYIVFSEYDYNVGSPITGGGEVHFEPVN